MTLAQRTRSDLRPALVVCLVLSAACGWWGDERSAIRRQLEAFTQTVNRPVAEGLGTVTRAAEIGRFFTEDVTVHLGRGSAPIAGREMLMGMAARLQPRTAEYRVQLVDVTVTLDPGEETAQVRLTAEFIRREPDSRRTMDAREFAVSMRREDGEWLIAGVEAVDTLR